MPYIKYTSRHLQHHAFFPGQCKDKLVFIGLTPISQQSCTKISYQRIARSRNTTKDSPHVYIFLRKKNTKNRDDSGSACVCGWIMPYGVIRTANSSDISVAWPDASASKGILFKIFYQPKWCYSAGSLTNHTLHWNSSPNARLLLDMANFWDNMVFLVFD